MIFAPDLSTVTHGIQLAVAPVFLLTAVSGMIAAVAGRLARIIDRARSLEATLPAAPEASASSVHAELRVLSRRARLVQRAITLSTACALLICVVIVALFAGVALLRDLSWLIMVLFIAALCAFIGALLAFLLEIQAATASLRFGPGPH